MISYELALKLKEAGFPQPSLMGIPVIGPGAIDKDGVFYPNLSELIEACGDCLSHLAHRPSYPEGGHWWAVSHCGHPEHEPGGNNLEESASTPEEAVARLWLALNKK